MGEVGSLEEGHEGTFWGDGSILYLDCGDD